MTKHEARVLLMEIGISYPTAHRGLSTKEADMTERLWYTKFWDVPLAIMELALNRHLELSKFPPTIAEMIEALRYLHNQAKEAAYLQHFMGRHDDAKRFEQVAQCTARFADTKNLGCLDINLLPERLDLHTDLLEAPDQTEDEVSNVW
jgi:hypothetical protein